jgi:hypothetical protein
MTRVITINGQRFVLPDNMSTKDIQALAGFLVTLTPVDYSWLMDDARSVYYASDRSAEVRLESLQLVTQSEAEAQGKASREAYDAKQSAKTAA